MLQRKNADDYGAVWSAMGEADVRTVVATARLTCDAGTFTTVRGTIST